MLRANKEGSQTVLFAMVFVALMMCLTLMIGVIRALVVKSECESFGKIWCRAVLSEYDRHLFDDYKIMAYYGNEAEVCKKIDSYLKYSANNKLDSSIKETTSELAGLELGIPDNFRVAVEKGFALSGKDAFSNRTRTKRTEKKTSEEYESRKILNEVVLDTLPSCGVDSSLSITSISKKIKEDGFVNSMMQLIKDTGIETLYLKNYFGNAVTSGTGKDGYFKNEWEYVINGKCDDDSNYKTCRNYLLLIRNAMNLAYLYKDPEKKELILTISECLSPGATGLLTQAAISELWAALETSKDLDRLYDGDEVPFMKTRDSWETDLSSLLENKDFKKLLDEEGEKLLSENKENLENEEGAKGSTHNLSDGQTYDDYLLSFILLMNKDTVMLRIMDLIQINMKYRYYEDFNMMEYYVGTRFAINANSKAYEFEDRYK